MTTSHQGAVLTAEDVAFIRRTLIACSQVLTCAQGHGDRHTREVIADATLAAHGNHTGLAYYANLAIDHLDFAQPAGSGRKAG